MQIQKKAFYNLKRLSWLDDKNTEAKLWEREDYRALPMETLLKRLEKKGYSVDEALFHELVYEHETPEDLSEALNCDDESYLLFFEIWRRLSPETQCFSLFCDELDHQITLYDKGVIEDLEPLLDLLGKLEVIIEENCDEGIDPQGVFEHIKSGLANDLEGFLYDFLAEQIDNGNVSLASELLDDLSECFTDKKWFTLLKIRILSLEDAVAANVFLRQLAVHEAFELEFNFEMLAFIAGSGEVDLFFGLVNETIPLLETEEDFRDLVDICLDFVEGSDKEEELKKLLERRGKRFSSDVIDDQDPDLLQLKKIVG